MDIYFEEKHPGINFVKKLDKHNNTVNLSHNQWNIIIIWSSQNT